MPKTHGMACSRAIPVDPRTAMRRTLELPLPTLFSRWYGPMGPVRAVHEYQSEPWGSAGQVRSIVQAGGTTLREELTRVDDPVVATVAPVAPVAPPPASEPAPAVEPASEGSVWPWILGGAVVVGGGVAAAILLMDDSKASDPAPPPGGGDPETTNVQATW